MRILITGTAVPEAGDAIIGNFRNFLDAPRLRGQIGNKFVGVGSFVGCRACEGAAFAAMLIPSVSIRMPRV